MWQSLPGLTIHDLMRLPIEESRRFFCDLRLTGTMDQAMEQLLGGIRSRLGYLCTVGLGYLTLDRQSRTLSGGEVQRVNLTTALGTALVNTLFVLDEPSIGLHPRDMDRVVGILHRLRDQGNSLLVVEHDPQVMLAADRILDIGPGPGERGGELVFQGTPQELLDAEGSLTGDYLAGRRSVTDVQETGSAHLGERYIRVLGATANNLKRMDIEIPLDRLVVVTGVSGSGKSTLVQDVLYNALAKLKGRPDGQPGAHSAIEGHDVISDVILLDQSPIGRTSRSNPASYVGALDPIRKRFAAEALAKERGYTAGTFSFNAGNGRCPTCGGSGFEHLEMQFLSDVYLRCPDCDGKRYRNQVLDVRIRQPEQTSAFSIAQILELTVTEALAYFSNLPEVKRALEPLEALGLGYLRLGQPVPTLSGGEAQRLKLAGHLAKGRKSRAGGGNLFLLDEPTTGLHFDDIATLLRAFRRLLRAGHSLIVIEHNLDVIRAADWLLDLGPEGGDAGGELVCAGTPREVSTHPTSHTGKALRDYEENLGKIREPIAPFSAAPPAYLAPSRIQVLHAREHNLKDLTLSIPRNKLTVITGVSGSGKSTLAFDILFAEGQRRYLESLNAYARQFVQPAARAEVDAIFGIPPTVAIEQRTSRGGYKSTVGTLTEIHHFLRLLFVKLGVQRCPECDVPIRPQSRDAILSRVLADFAGHRICVMAPLVVARKGFYTELANWAHRKGYYLLRVDGDPVPTEPWPRLDRYREHNIDLPVGELMVTPQAAEELSDLLGQALDHGKGTVRVVEIDKDTWGAETPFSTTRTCPGCGRAFEEPDPRLFSYNSKHGWCPGCYGTGLTLSGFDEDQSGEEDTWLETSTDQDRICPTCNGGRLNKQALAVRFRNRSIADISALSVDQVAVLLGELDFDDRESVVAADLVAEVRGRLGFLVQVGLGYLSLDRSAPTLSGGEAQRIRLAAQLGSNLRGVCYVLDEPTVGLHPRDNRMLLDALDRLEHKGNTILVVEHDEETIRRAEHVVDLGPGAGIQGGRLVAEGSAEELVRNPDSITGRYLGRAALPLRQPRSTGTDCAWLGITDARLHNLRGLDLKIPLGRLVCITGVSGSGKSTLMHDVLVRNLRSLISADRHRKGWTGKIALEGCGGLMGWEVLGRVLEVDQTPIGKTPRSCPATYVGFWDGIRRLFAATPEARMLGWGPGRFSFNTKGGRCTACEGQGIQRLAMSFLPDVKTTCEVCNGSRFGAETRQIRYKGRDIGEILAMGVDDAARIFSAHPSIHHALSLLRDVGLGYLTLGQQSPTLSGGEAQRIKLITELAKAGAPNGRDSQFCAHLDPHQGGAEDKGRQTNRKPTLYVLDEPTVGLHMADVERLISVLHRLVDAGHSVLVIEHNLDLIAAADWVLDLGPEGGDAGGRLIAEGPPALLATVEGSHTAAALREHIKA